MIATDHSVHQTATGAPSRRWIGVRVATRITATAYASSHPSHGRVRSACASGRAHSSVSGRASDGPWPEPDDAVHRRTVSGPRCRPADDERDPATTGERQARTALRDLEAFRQAARRAEFDTTQPGQSEERLRAEPVSVALGRVRRRPAGPPSPERPIPGPRRRRSAGRARRRTWASRTRGSGGRGTSARSARRRAGGPDGGRPAVGQDEVGRDPSLTARTVLEPAPGVREVAVPEPLDPTVRPASRPRNACALAPGLLRARRPSPLSTTQVTPAIRPSREPGRTVPPQPISMSSAWARSRARRAARRRAPRAQPAHQCRRGHQRPDPGRPPERPRAVPRPRTAPRASACP